MKNCPNCGAPLEPYKYKCEYCNTLIFDLAAFDLTGDSPCYVKFRIPNGVLTTLARPELHTIDVYQDSCNIVDRAGHAVKTIVTNRSCDISVTFHAQSDPSRNCLYTLEMNDGI